MVHTTPRERRREATLERIADAAFELVRTDGLAGLTMQRLAEAVDYTPGALYRYFPGKGALLADLNRRVLERVRGTVADAVAALGPPEDAPGHLAGLLATTRALLDEARARPGSLAVVAATMGDPTRLVSDEDAVHIPELLGFLSELAARIEAAAIAGALESGPADARALRWIFGGLGVLQLAKLSQLDARLAPWPLAEGLTTDLLRGWGADPEALALAAERLAAAAPTPTETP